MHKYTSGCSIRMVIIACPFGPWFNDHHQFYIIKQLVGIYLYWGCGEHSDFVMVIPFSIHFWDLEVLTWLVFTGHRCGDLLCRRTPINGPIWLPPIGIMWNTAVRQNWHRRKRALICFAGVLPSLYVNWVRWCASATIHHHQNTMSFRANGLLLCSNVICLIMATAAIIVSITHNIIGFEVFRYVQMKLV